MTGTGDLDGTANSLNNIIGNAGNNNLSRQGGNDFLSGGDGDDYLSASVLVLPLAALSRYTLLEELHSHKF